ncbi:sarcosine oxidase subunit delta [Paraburkholderia sp. UCT70]|uniref:sarcosine oxidase subunit delta n=1 Tax=Paraburkholderia sp. UCT70 TaxID=2991068 RepID=UPI003D1E0078
MLSIDCPVCGPRPEAEFHYIGEGDARIPDLATGDAELADYLYLHNNAAGMQTECWVHRHGCGEWLKVTRDVRRNMIASVGFLHGDAPAQEVT